MGPGVNIKRLRERAGWTQAELARRSGLASIKAIERGRRIGKLDSLEAIAKALGVSVSELFREPKPRKRA